MLSTELIYLGFTDQEIYRILSDPQVNSSTVNELILSLHERAIKAEETIAKARNLIKDHKPRSIFLTQWFS